MVILKFLRVLPKQYRQTVRSIESLLDLNTLSVEEGRLKVREEDDGEETEGADDTKQCATSLGLQMQSVVARVIFPTRMTRGKYRTLGEQSKKLTSFSSGNLQNKLLVSRP
jgi:hypothetical protein